MSADSCSNYGDRAVVVAIVETLASPQSPLGSSASLGLPQLLLVPWRPSMETWYPYQAFGIVKRL